MTCSLVVLHGPYKATSHLLSSGNLHDMDLFVSWHTEFDDEDPKFAVLADDSEALRRKNQAMDAGKRIIESWLLRIGGQTIDFNGADGHCQVPADELSDLERIRTQYSQTLGTVRVAMGVGIKLSEADQALKSADKQGGDKIVLYTPDSGGKEALPNTQSLNKADGPPSPTPKQPAMASKQAGGGFVGASEPMTAAAPVGASGEASEHSQAEAEQSALDNAPPAGELTHSAADAEAAFSDSADKADDDEKSQDETDGKNSADQDLKKEVIKVLQHVKAQAPALAQLTATEPKLFAVINESIHAMLMLAKRLCGTADAGAGQPVSKSDTTIIIIPGNESRKEETSAKDVVEPEWAYHMVSEWETIDGISQLGLVPHSEEGTATLHYTTDFDSVKDREGELLRFKCPAESNPNPYRPDKPTERITTLTIQPEDIQRAGEGPGDWEPLPHDHVLKSDLYFRHPAFLSKNGRVVVTPGFHDIAQLPEGFLIDQEGYVSGDGRFYDSTTAEEMAAPLGSLTKNEPSGPIHNRKLAKTEYRSGSGNDLKVVPGKDNPNRREFDRRCVREVIENIAHPKFFDLKPKMVPVEDLAWQSSGNDIKHPGRYNMYRRMLANGDRLPAIVVQKNGLKYDIVDGSHRVKATLDHNGTNVSQPAKIRSMMALEMVPKPKLAKAWPKDEQENQANAAAHPIMEDALMENGYQKQLKDAKGNGVSIARQRIKVIKESHKRDSVNRVYPPSIHGVVDTALASNAAERKRLGIPDQPSGRVGNAVRLGGGLVADVQGPYWKNLLPPDPEPIAKKLPLPENAPKNTHHEYPVGAVKDHSPEGTRDVGKVKVKHDNGRTGWVEVRAGQVMSQDGHPISSRNPGGK